MISSFAVLVHRAASWLAASPKIRINPFVLLERGKKDALSVVDGRAHVDGIGRLRIADASILPRIATGDTMAPSVFIDEIAAQSSLGASQ